jgi:phage gp36-like protein
MTITNDDLIKEISTRDLKEMSDLDAKGTLDQSVVDDCKSDALSFISSFFKLPNNPTPLLLNIAVKLTVIELKKRNGWSGEQLQEDMSKIESYLTKMMQGKIPTELLPNGETPAPEGKHRAFRHNKSQPLNLDGMQFKDN